MRVLGLGLWGVCLGGALAIAGCGDSGEGTGGETETNAESNGESSGESNGESSTSGPSTSGESTTSAGSTVTTEDPSASSTGEPATTTGTGEEFKHFELRAPDYSPPAVTTWYSCMAWNFPVEQAVHLVGFKPVVDDPHVHHYVLGVYDSPETRDPNDPCFQWVEDMVWGWAPGGKELWLPDDVGMRAGDNGTVTFVLQVHYNNPLSDQYVDSSGIDVFYTESLREHEAGIVKVGDIGGIAIPPGEPNHEHVAVCPSWATQAGLKEPLHVIGTWLHAHDIGKTLWTEVFRDGQMIAELGREDPFKFDYQTFQDADFWVEPGDEFQTHCVYDASDRGEWTYGGDATDQEMCINFMLYYPNDPNLESCGQL
ncbi:MAG: hypothetical protein H6713_13880 [Myxococcales bacterium]|nr:hypothetical protein [Myxococcales bacterium]MCB9751074.1 hypothetical protein [Myxococcales bacterium]